MNCHTFILDRDPPYYYHFPYFRWNWLENLNVVDSDGTLIVSHGRLTGDSQYTMDMAIMHSRPWLHINLNETTVLEAAQAWDFFYSEKSDAR